MLMSDPMKSLRRDWQGHWGGLVVMACRKHIHSCTLAIVPSRFLSLSRFVSRTQAHTLWGCHISQYPVAHCELWPCHSIEGLCESVYVVTHYMGMCLHCVCVFIHVCVFLRSTSYTFIYKTPPHSKSVVSRKLHVWQNDLFKFPQNKVLCTSGGTRYPKHSPSIKNTP